MTYTRQHFWSFGYSALTRDHVYVKDDMLAPNKISNNNNCTD